MKFPIRLATVATLALIALAGCSTISDMFPSVQNKVAALESAYTSAAALEMAYLDPRVPYCTGTGVKLCKTRSTVTQLTAADNAAYLAIKAARAAEDDTTYGAALAAINTFQAVTNGLPASK